MSGLPVGGRSESVGRPICRGGLKSRKLVQRCAAKSDFLNRDLYFSDRSDMRLFAVCCVCLLSFASRELR